jgi:ribosomal protein L23
VRTWPSRPAQAVFKVAPSMTKHEVREHLTKIYDLPVQRVMTANFAGAFVCFWETERERELRRVAASWAMVRPRGIILIGLRRRCCAGRYKRRYGHTKQEVYKQPRFKKAFVTFAMGAVLK